MWESGQKLLCLPGGKGGWGGSWLPLWQPLGLVTRWLPASPFPECEDKPWGVKENSAPRPAVCVPSSKVERAPQGSGLPCSAHPALPRPGAVLGHHPSLDTWPIIQQHHCPKKWASAGLDPWPALPLETVTPLFPKATVSCSLTPPHWSSNPSHSPHSATLAPLFLTDLRCSPARQQPVPCFTWLPLFY